ncbi:MULTISPECIES: hypothetical protein [Enterobacter cloacae complex]|uniref:hypothetical protein n=1 Tax=Enterobacter cloacae complex TaxID=354276 RepID=UPI000B0246D9|nr:hypothetical protein [Enterobacter hormaechei]CAE7102391.1 hypothetical protein AI2683V1_3226 [Enterobacter cloacae]MCI2657055.1 hypothetical protein [Enterobacter hormaechei]MCI2661695.1 hypothetical protein [Enterobacter hormaechei]MCI2665761.1 hypothetical protein [Enterobacter hormaechei]MCI2670403.1 hypothetical protein [Enterobacter hormaechei]
MSTITKELAKLFRKITNSEIDAEGNAHVVLSPADSLLINNARIALASLEAEAVCVIDQSNLDYLKSGSDADVWPASRAEMGDVLLYRSATPAPVSVPAAMEMDDDFDSSFEHGKAVGWNAYRAAMLQGADRPQNEPQNIPENIPATQFKPVADLYGLTSPTGGETSFTFDAVEARDFIDGGWSCQEYVELERFQEAITNHTEDKLAMVDHSGDSNNMVEPVTTACKLRDAVDTIRNSGIAIDGEKIFAERDALNAPDYWCRTCRPITLTDMRFVVCPDCGNKRCPRANDHRNACTGSNDPGQEGSAYPAAPQQEVK